MHTDPHPDSLAGTLYRPAFEHDACGAGFIAAVDGVPSHRIVDLALGTVTSLAHRGAVDANDGAETGDGAGLLTQLPLQLFERELGIGPLTAGAVGVGMLFLPAGSNEAAVAQCIRVIEASAAAMEIPLLAWRKVPTVPHLIGRVARESCPDVRQAFFARPDSMTADAFEATLYQLRRRIEAACLAGECPQLYVASLSSRTIVYKGLLVASQLASFYPDLTDDAYESAIAVFHQRYSTNTFPSWERAQPMRMLCHNGEINTVQGNVNWMRSREALLRSAQLGPGILDWVSPVVDTTGSDSAMLDNVLELMTLGGRGLHHAMTMLMPPAWEDVHGISRAVRSYCRWQAGVMEPWDGPAALSFTDGRWVGAALDRNGLRPARYVVTDDGIVACSSEAGSVAVDEARIVRKGKLGPGQMVMIDTQQQRIWLDEDIKAQLTSHRPWEAWLAESRVRVQASQEAPTVAEDVLTERQAAFGYTREELTVVLRPMLAEGKEAIGSMGDDTPHAALARSPRPLFSFFKQRFAEVTNPPIDPIRERSVMSLTTRVGTRANMLIDAPEASRLVELDSPILTTAELARVRAAATSLGMSVADLRTTMAPDPSDGALEDALDHLCAVAEQAVDDGHAILVLSDRAVDASHMPIPSMAALGAVHHHLIARGKRMLASLIVDSGEPRDVHHMAALIGYGANAVCPWLALETCAHIATERGKKLGVDSAQATRNFITAIESGLLKIMSKMGISTIDSYCGAQIFEAVGLGPFLVERCFPGTASRMGGIGFDAVLASSVAHHADAWGERSLPEGAVQLASPGFYKFKRGGEQHAFNPGMVRQLQEAVATQDVLEAGFDVGYEQYQQYSSMVHDAPPAEPRDLLQTRSVHGPIPLGEVEGWESIVRRFSTGAMSHGSLSSEAHETLAEAMNRLGASSNSGEGGEDRARFGTVLNSVVKQVASARFGVTPAYLHSARELQIKMAQGSKPGEGGQLPGHKVTDEIARIRHTVPGVALISPPPHHDIYSIEDLAQLIHDLKAVQPAARVTVKLVGQAGVGTIAAGVAKAHADGILISGHAGGTGASPLSSIKNAGMPWEVGLAETQQTLRANGLRGRVRVRVDGGLRTGRDVVTAALLGADEYSFGTVALVAAGCLMARACHNNTCPVGIATQRRDLRDKFPGNAERVMAFMRFVAEEVRRELAALGLRSLDEAVGRVDLLKQRPDTDVLELAELLKEPAVPASWPRRYMRETVPVGDHALNDTICARVLGTDEFVPAVGMAPPVIEPVTECYSIRNTDRTVGARLAGTIAARHGDAGLPDNTVDLHFEGRAGQSFGAFCVPGMRLTLTGEANDYVGKGLAGGELIVRPHPGSIMASEPNRHYIAGNTCLYGATAGTLFAAGRVGERFAVRNSGAVAVVEGVGDHGCEYMTGGVVVVIGRLGRNFAAGMTGGVAYVFDLARGVEERVNTEIVEVVSATTAQQLEVRELLERHVQATASARAQQMLDEWHEFAPLLRCIRPRVSTPQFDLEHRVVDELASGALGDPR